MEKIEALTNHLRMLALSAVYEVEARAKEFLVVEGKKLLSAEKRQWAINKVVELYQEVTANIPALASATWDDDLVRAKAAELVDWAFEQAEPWLNKLGRVPITDAPELSGGRVE